MHGPGQIKRGVDDFGPWLAAVRLWGLAWGGGWGSALGQHVGRPKLGIDLRQKIVQRAAKGQTPYAIAKALGIDRYTASKYAT
jgi:hypothetical protein